MNQFDSYFYHLINGWAGHNVALDQIMVFFAQYSPELYAGLFIVAWFTLPKDHLKSRHALVIAALSGILALGINMAIAAVWYRPRPFTVFPKGDFHLLVHHAPDASFPSDHVSGSFGFASATWGTTEKWIYYTFTLIAIIVMFARVFVGVHYPTDVLAGMVVGTLSGRLMWMASSYIYPLSKLLAKLSGFSQNVSSANHSKGRNM